MAGCYIPQGAYYYFIPPARNITQPTVLYHTLIRVLFIVVITTVR